MPVASWREKGGGGDWDAARRSSGQNRRTTLSAGELSRVELRVSWTPESHWIGTSEQTYRPWLVFADVRELELILLLPLRPETTGRTRRSVYTPTTCRHWPMEQEQSACTSSAPQHEWRERRVDRSAKYSASFPHSPPRWCLPPPYRCGRNGAPLYRRSRAAPVSKTFSPVLLNADREILSILFFLNELFCALCLNLQYLIFYFNLRTLNICKMYPNQFREKWMIL